MTEAVYGVRETMAMLKEIDPELRKECLKEIRRAAKPMADAISRNLPSSPPLRGMDNLGRLGWHSADIWKIKVVVGGRRNVKKDVWPLVSLKIVSPVGTLFDMAGRKSSNPLARALGAAGFGDASRAAWRTEAQLSKETSEAIRESIKKMSARLNKNVVSKPGSVI